MSDNKFYDEGLWSTAFGPKFTCPTCKLEKRSHRQGETCILCLAESFTFDADEMAGLGRKPFGSTSAGAGTATEESMRQSAFARKFYDAGFIDRAQDRLKKKREAEQAEFPHDNAKHAESIFRQQAERLRQQHQEELNRQARKQHERARQAPPVPPPQTTSQITLDTEMLRRLIQLCHPDRHGNSEASQKATRFLLDIKARR